MPVIFLASSFGLSASPAAPGSTPPVGLAVPAVPLGPSPWGVPLVVGSAGAELPVVGADPVDGVGVSVGFVFGLAVAGAAGVAVVSGLAAWAVSSGARPSTSAPLQPTMVRLAASTSIDPQNMRFIALFIKSVGAWFWVPCPRASLGIRTSQPGRRTQGPGRWLRRACGGKHLARFAADMGVGLCLHFKVSLVCPKKRLWWWERERTTSKT